MLSAASDPDPSVPPAVDGQPLVLFDLDGTVTDPADGIISCHRWALEQHGIEWDASVDPRLLIGPPAEEAHRMLGVADDRVEQTVASYRERFAVAGWLDDTTYPGIPELVSKLVDAGWSIGLATMKLEPFAERVLERVGLAEHFSVIAGTDVERTRASKRAVIESALERLDRTPSGVAMVGDRHHDIDAARSLSMTSIGAAWGFGSIEELMAAGAHAIAVEPHDVARVLLGVD